MPKGNKKAFGKTGNKGGTGRPPKSDKERLSKVVSFRATQELFDRINIATMMSCGDDSGEFLRGFLDKNLPR